MDTQAHFKARDERDEFPELFDLERQLEAAERRYAQTRASFDAARQEWRDMLSRPGADSSAVIAARGRVDAIAARCTRLLDLINELEQRLDS